MNLTDDKQQAGLAATDTGFRATRDFTFVPGQKTGWNKAGLEKFRAGQSAERIARDKKQLSRMFSLAAKSPELADALEWAESHGVEIIVDRTSSSVGGYYWAGSGVVALGEEAQAVGVGYQLALLIEEIDMISLLDRTAGEPGIVHDEVF